MIDRQELAWAAGFFDGEGHVCLHRCTPNGRGRAEGYVSLEVTISQIDPRVLYRFAEAVGHGRILGPYGYSKKTQANWRPFWVYKAYGAKARAAMQGISPWLSAVKAEQWGNCLLELEKSQA
jgi:hypothetical protein